MTDTLAALGLGLNYLFSWPNILIPLLGTALAMVVSFLPGIGAASLAAVMVVLTLHWDPVQVLLLFGALTGGATFMGSVTAILFGIPGNAASAVSLLDGHPMAQAGRPRSALAAAATASALGSVFGVVVLILLLPVIRPVLLHTGPLERAALAIWGLATIVAVLNGRPLRALAAAMLGLMLAMVGRDPASSLPRWSFGQFELLEGLAPEAMLLGFFTLSEVLAWRQRHRLGRAALHNSAPDDSIRAGVWAVVRHRALVIRSAIIGMLVGIIPGVGGTVAGFVAYGQTVQSVRGDRSGFGRGDIRGVIGPEAAIDSKDGGSLLPVLALGLPGSEGGVFLLSVLAIHGFTPGSAMLGSDLPFAFALILALLLSNLVTSAVGLGLVPALARLGQLPIDRIALPVLVVGLVTVVQLHGQVIDLFVAVGFAALGYLFRRLDWPRVPFIIAFVLGPSLEENLNLSMQLHAVGRLDIGTRPLAWVIFALTVFSIWWMVRRSGQRATTEPAETRAQIRATWGLGLAVLGFALIAFLGGAAYSGYARTLAGATIGLFGAVIVTQWHSARTGPAPAGDRLIPAGQGWPLALLLSFPLVALGLGLPIASAALVAAWLARWARLSARRAGLWAGVTLATAGAVALYLDRVVMLDLPPPLLPLLPGWAF